MHRFRFAILGAVAALALGAGGAAAMQQSAGGATDRDVHGDMVASAARHCPHGPNGVHGECVSDIAQSKSESREKEAPEDEGNPAIQACKGVDKSEDASESKPAKGDKAAKAADRTEDQKERAAFTACVQAAGGSASGS